MLFMTDEGSRIVTRNRSRSTPTARRPPPPVDAARVPEVRRILRDGSVEVEMADREFRVVLISFRLPFQIRALVEREGAAGPARRWVRWFLLMAGAIAASSGAAPGDGGVDPVRPQVVADRTDGTHRVAYLLSLPRPYDPRARYDLLVLMHPQGDHRAYMTRVQDVASRVRWLVACPEFVTGGAEVRPLMEKVEEVVAHVRSKYAARSDRFYLGGFSAGGQASYAVSYFLREKVAGIVNNSGNLHPKIRHPDGIRLARLEHAVILSGTGDAVARPEHLRLDAGILEQAGVTTRFLPYPGTHEIAPVETYIEALRWIERAHGPTARVTISGP